MAADGQPIILRELEGLEREVLLDGGALPNRGSVAYGGEQRVNRTFYPGSNTPSTQVLGVQFDDISLKGLLKDIWAGQVGYARATADALASIWKAQTRCELTWGDVYVHRGRVKRWEERPARESDLAYTLDFQVDEAVSIDEAAQPLDPPTTATTLSTDLDDAATSATSALEALATADALFRSLT